jgi:release factor glutamine methyltransferase
LFDYFLQILSAFEEKKVDSPLIETLKLFDFMTKGAIQTVNESVLRQSGVDFESIVAKRKDQIPYEYIFGRTVFMGLEFQCSPEALIPRKETELLASCAIERLNQRKEPQLIIDMGTGCANIAVAIACNTENTTLLATDLKKETTGLARKNIEFHNVSDKIHLFYGDLFSPLPRKYEQCIDMVVCNPPYLPSTTLKNLPKEIIGHEPKEAFDAGAFGIDFFKRLITGAAVFLKPNGILIFEIGKGQEKLVTRLISKNDAYHNIQYYHDGQDIRVISAEKC